ncbi:MAG: NUDIX domain-containing protein [Polyangiaceae bacterium]|nr:NUDIX domain-containing protein [Polyangiaceae bacterium]
MTKRLRASLVCEAEGLLLVVRLRDPVTGVEGLFPPGGAVEEGETPSMAAVRETLEETGIVVTTIPDIVLCRTYPFRWAGVDYEVTTQFFAARLDRAPALPAVVDADYNLGASWIPVDAALVAMAIHPPISTAVEQVLRAARLMEDGAPVD